MKKKRFRQSCSIGPVSERKAGASKKRFSGMDARSQKDLERIYNKFYRDQVAALYRAVRGS
jgi:hypothetical protein